MADAIITLAQSFDHFGPVDAVVLREPRARHLFKYGEPRFLVSQGDGAMYWVEREDAIRSYVNELLGSRGADGAFKAADGGGLALLDRMTLEDGIAVRDALFDFFSASRLARSRRNATSSSST